MSKLNSKNTMRKHGRKISILMSMVLVFSMLFSGASVYASEPVAAEDDFVVTYSAEEVTDIDELLEMALEQSNNRRALDLSDDIIVTQLLEKRVYKSGNVENLKVKTSIKGITPLSDAPGSASDSDSYYSNFLTVSLYYTQRVDSLTAAPTYRVDKVVSAVIGAGSGVVPKSGLHFYNIERTNGSVLSKQSSFSCNSVTSNRQTFTLTSGHSGFYSSRTQYVGINATCTVNLSDGSSLYASTGINLD